MEMKTDPAKQWDSQIKAVTRKLQETKTVYLLTTQKGTLVGLCSTNCDFVRQCVEDAKYAKEHNQTSGQRWLEQRQCNNSQMRYNESTR